MLLELCFIILVLVVAIMAAAMVGVIGEMKALREHVRIMTASADQALIDSPDIRKRLTTVERQCVGINRVLKEIEKRRNKFRPDRRHAEHI